MHWNICLICRSRQILPPLDHVFRIQTLHQPLIDIPKFSRVLPSGRLLSGILMLLSSQNYTRMCPAVDFLIDVPNWFQDDGLKLVLKESYTWQPLRQLTKNGRLSSRNTVHRPSSDAFTKPFLDVHHERGSSRLDQFVSRSTASGRKCTTHTGIQFSAQPRLDL